MAVAIELQTDAGGSKSRPRHGTDEKGQVEPCASVARTPVEVQPLGPRRGELRHVGLRMKAIERAQHAGLIDVLPSRIRRRVHPCRHAFHLGIADGFFQTGHAAVPEDADRLAVLHQVHRRVTGRRRGGRQRAHARQHERRVLDRSERAEDEHVAAARERRRSRLLENHVADAEQRRHDGDAQAESARQHGGANRPDGERSQGKAQNHSRMPDRIVRRVFARAPRCA